MYDLNSVAIVAVLFLALLVALELGFRSGRRYAPAATDPERSQLNTIQGSLLGVLALLLGFTFSLSLQRYDSRSQAVVEEANAIGTALYRASLLPESVRADAGALLESYVELRIEAGRIPLHRTAERADVVERSARTLDELWRLTLAAKAEDPGPVTTGLFVQSFNDVADAYAARDAALSRHVPEIVLFLLFGTFVLTVGLVGFSAGFAGHRANFGTYVLMILIVSLVFIIIDLDRPRRGLIEVSQQSMMDLREMPSYTEVAEPPR